MLGSSQGKAGFENVLDNDSLDWIFFMIFFMQKKGRVRLVHELSFTAAPLEEAQISPHCSIPAPPLSFGSPGGTETENVKETIKDKSCAALQLQVSAPQPHLDHVWHQLTFCEGKC